MIEWVLGDGLSFVNRPVYPAETLRLPPLEVPIPA
jgi:hypothetical protein